MVHLNLRTLDSPSGPGSVTLTVIRAGSVVESMDSYDRFRG
jgi:hypothetical protein